MVLTPLAGRARHHRNRLDLDASALSIGRDLGAFVTYDNDLADAARALRMDVLAPS